MAWAMMIDVGTYNFDPGDCADCAEAVGRAIHSGRAELGVLICSSIGASVAANKICGIRAGLYDTYSPHQGVEHDDMNVLVLGA